MGCCSCTDQSCASELVLSEQELAVSAAEKDSLMLLRETFEESIDVAAEVKVTKELENEPEEPIEKPEGPLVITINLGPRRKEQLVINPGEDRMTAARRFADKHRFTRADKAKFCKSIRDWRPV